MILRFVLVVDVRTHSSDEQFGIFPSGDCARIHTLADINETTMERGIFVE